MATQRAHGIAWTEETWNPIRGCSRVSPGCEHCYAERVAARFSGAGEPYQGLAHMTPAGPRWTRVVRELQGATLSQPLRWTRPRLVFVNSMSDLFHEALPVEAVARVWAAMALAPRHTYQVLTKRALGMCRLLSSPTFREAVEDMARDTFHAALPAAPWPLANVWLGVSVETQEYADDRIPYLLETPAAVRWVSAEPQLGPITYRPRPASDLCIRCGLGPQAPHDHPDGYRTHGLDWIVVGGESGPGARPFDVTWARATLAEGRAAGVPVFVKQLGAQPYDSAVGGDWTQCRLTCTGKAGDPLEWPVDLRVREWPAAMQYRTVA